ncbi:hypothetical protein VTL71DRAFT_9217 [Oculimacula yallundae]|uniref:Uncharacterized protein n=1 Tax=Oculimacula yallundae TaxID=86028 RepID=A0ABR4BTN9_9HELO
MFSDRSSPQPRLLSAISRLHISNQNKPNKLHPELNINHILSIYYPVLPPYYHFTNTLPRPSHCIFPAFSLTRAIV